MKERDGRSFPYVMEMFREVGFAIVSILQMGRLKFRDLLNVA